MKSRFNKRLILWSAAICIAFGYNSIMASTNISFVPSYVGLTTTSSEEQVFFEAEKLYSVNFVDQSPRAASQAKHDLFMDTSANNISDSSKRISRNLRGFDLFYLEVNRIKSGDVSFNNSYITNTLIYRAQNLRLAIAVPVKPNSNLMQKQFFAYINSKNAFFPQQ